MRRQHKVTVFALVLLLSAFGALHLTVPKTINTIAEFQDGVHCREPQPSALASPTKRGPPLLTVLAQEPSNQSCPSQDFMFRRNIISNHSYVADQNFHSKRRIPKIIHQTSKSRCLRPTLYVATETWQLDGWSYYFHDDVAMENLLQSHFPEFPHLSKIVNHCLTYGTLKADLWRYLILWVYGGLYADIDTIPNEFSADTIQPIDDGFFVVELDQVLSQYFMAMSPHHPLMYYAIQHSLSRLLQATDTNKQYAPYVTGPQALHAAFVDFRYDIGIMVDRNVGDDRRPVWNGTFVGSQNRSIRVVGTAQNDNQFVRREVIDRRFKKKEYEKMGMKHFFDYNEDSVKSNVTCLSAIRRGEHFD